MCNRTKGVHLFHKQKRSKDGYRSICKSCVKKTSGRTKRNHHLTTTYGISLAEYEKILDTQHGQCYICLKRPGKKSLSVDHNHKNGRIRGLLCNKCNRFLGHVRDDPEAGGRLAGYLIDDGGIVEGVIGRDQRARE